MAIMHNFYIISKRKKRLEDILYTALENNSIFKFQIEDYFITYIIDSLKWIKTYNPSCKTFDFGLNYHGISIIDKENSLRLNNIIKSWKNLFINAVDVFELTGPFCWTEGTEEVGDYEYFTIKKNDLLKKIKNFIEFINKSIGEDMILIHIGV